MSGFREVILGDGQVRLINADCREVLPTLGKVDAVVTEIEPKYFDIACRRIKKALAQGDMFIERPKAEPIRQESML